MSLRRNVTVPVGRVMSALRADALRERGQHGHRGFRSLTEQGLDCSSTDAEATDAPGIGVYRGGVGCLKGAWRPNTTTCLMHKGREFCTVCREALVLRIYRYVDPIDGVRPAPAEQVDPERDGRYRTQRTCSASR